jgi:hypothetical protein
MNDYPTNLRGMLPLDKLTHAELVLRRRAPDADHELLAPMEHRAFAREWAQEEPLLAGVSLPFAVPAYTAAKAAGLTNARSPASLVEIMSGYHGMFEGLLNALRGAGQGAPVPSERMGVRGALPQPRPTDKRPSSVIGVRG